MYFYAPCQPHGTDFKGISYWHYYIAIKCNCKPQEVFFVLATQKLYMFQSYTQEIPIKNPVFLLD